MKKTLNFKGVFAPSRIALAFALLFAVGTFGFYACSNKESAQAEVKPENVVRNNKNALANPYSQIGTHHNEGLLYIGQQADFGNQSGTRIAELSRQFAVSRGYNNLSNNTFDSLSNEVLRRVNDFPNLKLSIVGNDYNFSQRVKDALNEIETVILNGASSQNISDVSAELQAIQTGLINLEQTFLARNYTSQEQSIIMPTISVAINSCGFWKNALEDANNSFNPILEETRRGKGFWFILNCIARVVLGDAVGAVVGTFVGAALGGPGGAGCGALIGAVSCSAGTAALTDFNKHFGN